MRIGSIWSLGFVLRLDGRPQSSRHGCLLPTALLRRAGSMVIKLSRTWTSELCLNCLWMIDVNWPQDGGGQRVSNLTQILGWQGT